MVVGIEIEVRIRVLEFYTLRLDGELMEIKTLHNIL